MNLIFEYINRLLLMTEKEIEELTPLLKTKTLIKDEFLLSENQTCNFLAFIAKGYFRSFHTNTKGNSTNLMLNSANEFISNYESYISGLPSNVSIQSIENFT